MKFKHCLAIETTGPNLGLALVAFDPESGTTKSLAVFSARRPLQQSELLLPELARLLKRAKLKKTDLNLIVVDVGPGSFTGVRVGVSAARALAQALDVPLIGVASLEALAHQTSAVKSVIAASIPALAGEIYFAVYQRNGAATLAPLIEPAWDKVEVFEAALEKWTGDFVRAEGTPHPSTLAAIGLQRYLKGRGARVFSYDEVVPMYLQPSWAERNA